MATDVNKESRKRKSNSDLIFEVDEADFSPSISPEPTVEIESGEISETEMLQTSTDTSKISEDVIIKKEEIKMKQKIEINFDELNGKLEYEMTSNNLNTNIKTNECELESSLKLVETDTIHIKENIAIKKETIIKEDKIIKNIINEDSCVTQEVFKTDADLQCIDMEVANSPPPALNSEKPFVSLIFRDKNAALHIGPKVMHYIKSVIDFELKVKVTPFPSDYTIDFWEDKIEETFTPNTLKTNIQEPEFDNLDLFVVDKTPSKKPELLPRYLPTNQCKTLGEKEVVKVDNSLKCRSTSMCFNCEGNHAIKDCKEVRNQRRITLARNRFRAQQKNTRYHVDDEVKFQHISAGKISDELRRALDVRKHELPPYIYRMRTLGYPPGWLQEAMISNSNLELFDFEGCAIQDGGGDCNNKIDPSKVIEYAGFNTPLEKGYKDEFKYYNCPPYNDKFSKTCMVQYIEQISTNMAVKPEIVQKANEIKESESDSNSQESQVTEKIRRSESPTLTDLELRKKQLLAELEDGSLSSPQPNNDTTIIINDKINPLSKDILESPNVVSSSMGTPVLKSSSPFIQLPEPVNFSKDICQVINFENLPDSTGKYEQMTVVINKIRETVKNNKS